MARNSTVPHEPRCGLPYQRALAGCRSRRPAGGSASARARSDTRGSSCHRSILPRPTRGARASPRRPRDRADHDRRRPSGRGDVSSEDPDERAAGSGPAAQHRRSDRRPGRRPDERGALRAVRAAERTDLSRRRRALGPRSGRRRRLRARARDHDDLRGAQSLRDLARQHRRTGARLRRDERISSICASIWTRSTWPWRRPTSPRPSDFALPVLSYLELGQSGRGMLSAGAWTSPRSSARRWTTATRAGGESRRSRAPCCPPPRPTCWRSGARRTTMERSWPPTRCGSSSRAGPAAPWGDESSDGLARGDSLTEQPLTTKRVTMSTVT